MSTREPRLANGISNGVNGVDGVNGVHKDQKGAVFDSIEESIEAFARGEFVVVLDSAHRENEGDLIIAAEHVTTEKMAFMIRHTSGYICAPVTAARAAKLDLPPMVAHNADPNRTAYTVSVDAVGPGTTTGISAQDRAFTLRTLASAGATAQSFRRPGHVIPLQARDGGVRARYGHTEAGVELCRLAGKQPAAAICEMIRDGEPVPGKTAFSGGGMMTRDDCLEFGSRWGIKVCTIEDLVAYVEAREGELEQPGEDY